eukprot:SAG22_NODE_684_length_7918_cov_6.380356_7_plen_140_part_00
MRISAVGTAASPGISCAAKARYARSSSDLIAASSWARACAGSPAAPPAARAALSIRPRSVGAASISSQAIRPIIALYAFSAASSSLVCRTTSSSGRIAAHPPARHGKWPRGLSSSRCWSARPPGAQYPTIAVQKQPWHV